ncbi:hypothetical protein ml_269 [Mollivirus sibericum]|uniref:hypothetical protein n=1 Tax=Mollivirus sibericum TaxID=1678078 RepID=UPI0006B2E34F|nr:hypothetical protein ml_269 [Mollivirus sibericum]ALD62071.1 hypothetical protein ml_269 [Mollivirus sibericum]
MQDQSALTLAAAAAASRMTRRQPNTHSSLASAAAQCRTRNQTQRLQPQQQQQQNSTLGTTIEHWRHLEGDNTKSISAADFEAWSSMVNGAGMRRRSAQVPAVSFSLPSPLPMPSQARPVSQIEPRRPPERPRMPCRLKKALSANEQVVAHIENLARRAQMTDDIHDRARIGDVIISHCLDGSLPMSPLLPRPTPSPSSARALPHPTRTVHEPPRAETETRKARSRVVQEPKTTSREKRHTKKDKTTGATKSKKKNKSKKPKSTKKPRADDNKDIRRAKAASKKRRREKFGHTGGMKPLGGMGGSEARSLLKEGEGLGALPSMSEFPDAMGGKQ